MSESKLLHSFSFTSEVLCLPYDYPKSELWTLETELAAMFLEISDLQGGPKHRIRIQPPEVTFSSLSLGQAFEMLLFSYRRVNNLI